LITVALSTTIGVPAEHVWRALLDPTERSAWDERILGEVAPARGGAVRSSSLRSSPSQSSSSRTERSASPSDDQSRLDHSRRDARRAGQRQRWRFRLGGVPLVMQDELLSAERLERIVSRITIGSMHFDQTLTLHSEDDETGPRTRLGMKIIARNSIAVIGDIIPRLDVQKIVIEYVDTTLRQLQKYCEGERTARPQSTSSARTRSASTLAPPASREPT
jgi:hypothetical protein